jgi:hypothetical protein
MENKFAQINTDWQEGVAEPLTGEEEEAARNYINKKLVEWKITDDDENVNDYIVRAWEEWVATPEAVKFNQQH